MKIIFLDIDGVLNNTEWCAQQRSFKKFSPRNVAMLNHIVSATGAKVVISSNWRLYPYNFPEMFAAQGIKCEIIGMTPILSTEKNGILRAPIRGEEIKAWLNAWQGEKIDSFVILDDDSDMGDLRMYLLQTDNRQGLTENTARKAIIWLGLSQATPPEPAA